jgi:hypothetical protein
LEITAGLGQEIHRVERLLASCIGRAPVPRLAAAAPELAQWSPPEAFEQDECGQETDGPLPVEQGWRSGGTRQSSPPEFATDGKRFYFTIAERESDIWRMELEPSSRTP